MTIPDVAAMSRYVSPVNPKMFPHLSIVLLGIGLFFTAWFFVYEVRELINYLHHDISIPLCGWKMFTRWLNSIMHIKWFCIIIKGNIEQVYSWTFQRATDCYRGIYIYGIWNFVFAPVGWHLRLNGDYNFLLFTCECFVPLVEQCFVNFSKITNIVISIAFYCTGFMCKWNKLLNAVTMIGLNIMHLLQLKVFFFDNFSWHIKNNPLTKWHMQL